MLEPFLAGWIWGDRSLHNFFELRVPNRFQTQWNFTPQICNPHCLRSSICWIFLLIFIMSTTTISICWWSCILPWSMLDASLWYKVFGVLVSIVQINSLQFPVTSLGKRVDLQHFRFYAGKIVCLFQTFNALLIMLYCSDLSFLLVMCATSI